MADPVGYGNPDRDIEQALITLKKGTQLIKYSRKGKPKFCPFRISPDETLLIWYSSGNERKLSLSSVSRIIPGQRTAVFKRYLRPEKDYLSFSLIYNNGERSLDLICKDKVESEVWLAGLKYLTGQDRSRRTRSDISDLYPAISDSLSTTGRPFGATLEFTSSIVRNNNNYNNNNRASFDSSSGDSSSLYYYLPISDAERASNMQIRTSIGDGFRLSVSSTTPSCSSHGSGPDDIESLGDVYVWGHLSCDTTSSSDVATPQQQQHQQQITKNDVLLPRPLESNVVLDVQQIACGVRHFALVTRQGEVFTWGEESGGRLGHGIEKDFSRPRLVDFLAVTNVDFVACGEFHTCAVSVSGDIYTWGDGAHNVGLLGHGTDVSHWVPKRVSGPLEGFQVLSVACGTWHTALVTANGKLFTFGDGTFGALGHGDRESVPYPKEVHLLSKLKSIKVSCGVWHTAAIVDVPGQGPNISSRKLFTWGDGDKYRLGHGNKESYLVPTCVSSLIDYNFHQLACGHFITVALTTSGHVFTMGSSANGQLGNPQADGKSPCLVQDRLVGEFVEEISCGAYHVAVLTSRSEIFTWGRGSNGRLGHGDTEDRNTPTLVEALKDKHVKSISCGSNYTASICIHKWVSGADQSVCSGCRQAFGFTRKRHNCYNCGLVHCHACSSKKALKAALAPTPGKPHRVCDSCYSKLKSTESGGANTYGYNRKYTAPRRSADGRERMDGREARTSRMLLSPVSEPVKYLEVKPGRPGSQPPSLLNLKDIAFPSSLTAIHSAFKPNNVVNSSTSMQPQTQASAANSRSSSPLSRRPSPTRSATPTFSRGVIENLKKTTDVLNQEVKGLQNQIRSMKQKSEQQDGEIKKLQTEAQEANSAALQESSKNAAAREVIRSFATQLKEVTEKLPPEIPDRETFKEIYSQAEAYLTTNGVSMTDSFTSDTDIGSRNHSTMGEDSPRAASSSGLARISENIPLESNENGSSTSQAQKEVIEQFEHGVYVTLIQLPNGTRVFKRVRFSKRRFASQQAEEWWRENKDRLFEKYSSAIAANVSTSTPSDENNEASSSQT